MPVDILEEDRQLAAPDLVAYGHHGLAAAAVGFQGREPYRQTLRTNGELRPRCPYYGITARRILITAWNAAFGRACWLMVPVM